MPDAPLPDPAAQTNPANTSIFGPHHLTRLLIAIMVVVSCAIYIFGARWVNWPLERGYRGSLAQPPASIGALVLAAGLLMLCTIIGTLVLGRRFFMGGLMVATAGLTTWAVRGGPSTFVLFNASDSGANGKVFLQLLGELIVLFGVIGALWNGLWRTGGPLAASGSIWFARPSKSAAAKPSISADGRSAVSAILAQSALMAVLVLILVATPLKKQVLTGVFLAGVLSTGVAEYFFADKTAGRWYWVGPLLAGALGYIANYFSPAGIELGDLTGMFGPMARVLPLDYASLGCAGALMGYWWMTPDGEETPGENTELPK